MKQYFKENNNHVRRANESGLLIIATYIKVAKEALATYLQLKAERLTKKNQKLLLLLFSLLFGGGSIAVILYSFTSISSLPITPTITFPKYAQVHELKPKIRDSLISHKEYARINQFRQYMKNLQQDADGKRIYDSLLQARPLLLDSIRLVDSIYLNQ